MSEICLPMGVDRQDIKKLEHLVKSDHIQHSGDVVLRQGDAFQKVYAVKSGMYKSINVDTEGHEHIIGFHLPGELIGLDAIYPKAYRNTTVAVTTSVLCELEYDQLTALSTEIPALQQQFLRLLSKGINDSNAFHKEQTAEQKLTGFVYNLAKRYEARGYSASELVLVMTRQDIASHLGMAAETISRLLKRLQSKQVLAINSREITILDEPALLALAGCEAAPNTNQTLHRLNRSSLNG